MSSTEFDARRYWDKRLERDWSLHGVGMMRLAHRYNRWMYRVRRRVFARAVRRAGVDLARARVLDIGSGTGFYVNLWRKHGAAQVNGVDIADSAVARLRAAYPDVRFARQDISDELPFPDEEFDAVTMFDVLFHIVDDDRYRTALTNIHQQLKTGGVLIFTENYVPRAKRGQKHYVSRSRAEIEELLRDCGFDVVDQLPAFVLMAPPVASASRWRSLLWRRGIVPLSGRERPGGIVGAALYPLEVALTRLVRTSPVMEVTVCRKRAEPAR